ncbi:MAG: monovalent cation/H+ antiporter complex subunit F [Candidatus Thermoplasmatota archaeon]|nr:monovalent cation/H+ antiporter complex subunit F [Candidatus Thermoplasmatota archaeon]
MIIFIVFLIGVAFCSSYRLIVGPSIQDRLVAVNSISIIFVIILALYSFDTGNMFFLDVAISYLLLDFVGMIAFTKYLGGEEIR